MPIAKAVSGNMCAIVRREAVIGSRGSHFLLQLFEEKVDLGRDWGGASSVSPRALIDRKPRPYLSRR
jgi:hypothetical protein